MIAKQQRSWPQVAHTAHNRKHQPEVRKRQVKRACGAEPRVGPISCLTPRPPHGSGCGRVEEQIKVAAFARLIASNGTEHVQGR